MFTTSRESVALTLTRLPAVIQATKVLLAEETVREPENGVENWHDIVWSGAEISKLIIRAGDD
jgi:hypothetical protein